MRSLRIPLTVAILSIVSSILSNTLSVQAADAVFTNVPASFVNVRGGAMAWGDYDNDGYLDVMIAGDPGSGGSGYGTTVLYHNNGDGSFTRTPFSFADNRSASIAWGDFDNDGYLDVLVSGLSGVRLYHNLGGTNFVQFIDFGSNDYDGKVDWGDFNNDGKLDFAVSGAGGNDRVFQNLNGTNFAQVNLGLESVYYGSVAWSDYDRDGHLDLLLTGMGNGVGSWAYHNNGNGKLFSATWTAGATDPGHWLDIDNDGWPDLAVGSFPAQTTYVFRNNREGGFSTVAMLPIGPVLVGDFNSDGWSDLLINNKVFQNSGAGAWTPVTTSLPDIGTSGLINNAFCGDYDNDGRLDLILSDSSYTTYLFRNVTTATNAPPSAPTNLHAAASRTNVVFSWSDATDDHQTNGLTYNLRVGTSPGGCDVISPMSGPDGFRRVVHTGNAGSVTFYPLAGLTPGRTYYWSVQAVDNSFAGGAFASEHSFVATAAPTISGFADQTVWAGSPPLVLPFTVGDVETPANELVVSVTSSNPQLLGPADLVVSGIDTRRTLTITPQLGQSGETTITVTVTDGDGGQSATQFQLTVSNSPPSAAFVVSPLVQLPGLSNPTILTPGCDDAVVVLNGSQSTDPDGDALQFAWSDGTRTFANGMVVTNKFTPGTYQITLSVSDGVSTNTATVQFDVIAPARAVAALKAFIPTTSLRQHGNMLQRSLQSAENSFSRCQRIPGARQLQVFEVQVHALLARSNPDLAQTLMRSADEIIQAVGGKPSGAHSIPVNFPR